MYILDLEEIDHQVTPPTHYPTQSQCTNNYDVASYCDIWFSTSRVWNPSIDSSQKILASSSSQISDPETWRRRCMMKNDRRKNMQDSLFLRMEKKWSKMQLNTHLKQVLWLIHYPNISRCNSTTQLPTGPPEKWNLQRSLLRTQILEFHLCCTGCAFKIPPKKPPKRFCNCRESNTNLHLGRVES